MGFDLGALFRTMAQAPGAVQEGEQAAKKAQQDALRQALLNKLTEQQLKAGDQEMGIRSSESAIATQRAQREAQDADVQRQGRLQQQDTATKNAARRDAYRRQHPEVQYLDDAALDRVLEEQAKPQPRERPQWYVDPVTGQGMWAYPPDDAPPARGPVVGGGANPPTAQGPAGSRVVHVGQVRTPTATERETNAAAKTSKQLVDEALGLIAKDKSAMTMPVTHSLASGLEGIANKVGLGGAVHPLSQQTLTPNQAAFQQKMDQILHFAGSVLPKGGRSVAILNNLRGSYSPSAGAVNPDTFIQALHDLRDYLDEVQVGGGQSTPPSSGMNPRFAPKR